MSRIKLKVKRSSFYCLLLVATQTAKAIGEGVGNAEVHMKL
jgi:hypothetical protein